MAELIEEDLIIEEAPEADAPEIIVEEPKPDTPSVDETLEALKAQLEDERKAREASDRRAHDATQQAVQAASRAQESEINLVNNAIGSLESTNESLREKLAEAYQEQDFSLVADIQTAMATNLANLTKLREGKQAMEAAPRPQAPPADPVEALASQLSSRSGDWIRKHPEFARDQRLFQKMLGAHNMVTAEGVQADTDEYFGQIEKMLGIGSTDAPPPQHQSRSAPPAAPVSRASNGIGASNPNRVTLTADEREIARMMGMSDKEYAIQKLAIAKEKHH